MPARLSDIERAVKAHAVVLDTGSKHWKFTRAGDRVYPVPAHNGLRTEIDDKYIKGLCRNFEIDWEAFSKTL